MPTTFCSSPTTTSAVKEKRRPPLTTLATRLISTTRSCRSRPAWLTLRSTTGALIARTSDLGCQWRWAGYDALSYGQSSFANALCEGLDAAVVLVAAAIEDRGRDACGLGALGEQLAGRAGLLHRRLVAQRRLGPRHGRKRVAGEVV